MVKKNLRNNPNLQAAYEEAQRDRADALAENFQGSDKSAFVQQLPLRVDTRKWVAARLHTRKWAERVDVNVTETRISISAALAEAERRVLIRQWTKKSVLWVSLITFGNLSAQPPEPIRPRLMAGPVYCLGINPAESVRRLEAGRKRIRRPPNPNRYWQGVATFDQPSAPHSNL